MSLSFTGFKTVIRKKDGVIYKIPGYNQVHRVIDVQFTKLYIRVLLISMRNKILQLPHVTNTSGKAQQFRFRTLP
jgi:hypothetical protein